MKPEGFPGLSSARAELLLPIARERFPDQVMALAWWPAPRCGAGLVMLAFAAELDAIPRKVREPSLGLVRFAFWREVLEELAEGRARAHPVAEGLKAVRAEFSPDTQNDLEQLIDAATAALPEVEGARPPDPHALQAALLPGLVRLAAPEALTASALAPLGRLVSQSEGEAPAEDLMVQWRTAWQAGAPFAPAAAPVAGAAKLAFRRGRGRPVSDMAARASLFLTVLRGK